MRYLNHYIHKLFLIWKSNNNRIKFNIFKPIDPIFSLALKIIVVDFQCLYCFHNDTLKFQLKIVNYLFYCFSFGTESDRHVQICCLVLQPINLYYLFLINYLLILLHSRIFLSMKDHILYNLFSSYLFIYLCWVLVL